MDITAPADLKKSTSRSIDRTLLEFQSRSTHLGKLITERKIAKAFGDQKKVQELSLNIAVSEERLTMLKTIIKQVIS